MIQFAILLLQVARQLFTYLESQRLIAEGERRQIAKELSATANAARISMKVQEDVGRMHDNEVDAALRGDYRD